MAGGTIRALSVGKAYLANRPGGRGFVYGAADNTRIPRSSLEGHAYMGIHSARRPDHVPDHTRAGPNASRAYSNHAGMIIIGRVGAGVKKSARADMGVKIKMPADPDPAFGNHHHIIKHAVMNHGVVIIDHLFIDHTADAFKPVFPLLLNKEIRGDFSAFFAGCRSRKKRLVGPGNCFKGVSFQVFKKDISIGRVFFDRIMQRLCARDRVDMVNSLKRF